MGRALAGLDDSPDRLAPRNIEVLDGLRGAAALLVFVSHSANLGLLPLLLGRGLGQQGVALFFILSGFLMAYLYGDRLFERAAVGQYVRHRTGRVLPLYLTVVLVAWLIERSGGFLLVYSIQGELIPHLFMVFGTSVLWSIPVEMQFYVVFLIIWYFASKGGRLSRRLVQVESGIAFASVLIAIVLLTRGIHNGCLPFWIPFFLLGTTVGYLYRRRRLAILAVGREISVGLGMLVLIICSLTAPGLRVSVGFPTLPNWIDPITVAGPILLFGVAIAEIPATSFLRARPLKYLGRVSFAFYLLHIVVLTNLNVHLHPDSRLEKLATVGLAAGVTMLLSVISLHVLEFPAQEFIRNFSLTKWVSVNIFRAT